MKVLMTGNRTRGLKADSQLPTTNLPQPFNSKLSVSGTLLRLSRFFSSLHFGPQ